MNPVQQVTDDTLQKRNLVLPDGTTMSFTMYYIPMQYGWFITSLTYGTFTLSGLRICNSPNMLHQFRNRIPFGLACFTQNNREPTQQEDFNSGASTLYILSAAEVNQYAEILSGQASA